MLTITLPAVGEMPVSDDVAESNVGAMPYSPAVKLDFEHSLSSLSKWEEIHERPFFGREPMSHEQTLSYIKQMLLTKNPPEDFLKRLTPDDFETITAYINSRHTATTFREEPGQKGSSEVITNEVIYHWMIQFQIPWDAQYWHLNRLMTLIKICGIKQTKPKKMSRQAQAEEYRRLNAERRRQLGSSG